MKLFVLVIALIIVVVGSQAITVLDNTKQQSQVQDVTRRRPTLPMRDNSHVIQQQTSQNQAVAETRREEVKVKGFRTAVVHKPVSSDGQAGGLTVQDPPKGWPFSEIQVNFNSHISDEDLKRPSSILTLQPEDNKNSHNRHNQQLHHDQHMRTQHQNQQLQQQQQLQLRQQRMNQHNQNLIQEQQLPQQQLSHQQLHYHHQQQHPIHPQQNTIQPQIVHSQPYQVAASIQSGNEQLNNGFIQTVQPPKVVQNKPPPFIITSNNESPKTRFVPGNDEEKFASQTAEKSPRTRRPNSGVHTAYNIGFVTPPDAFAHSNQMLNVIKNELPTAVTKLAGNNDNELRVHHSSNIGHINNNQQHSPPTHPLKQSNVPHSSQVIHIQPNTGSNQNPQQATSSISFQHSEGGVGNPNYIWRDVSPGLEVSSNAPHATGVSPQNSANGIPKTLPIIKISNEVMKGGQGSATSGHSANIGILPQSHATHYITGTHLHGNQVAHFQTFDHANALGHSDNFGYRDAMLSIPGQINVGISQINQGHLQQAFPVTQNLGQNLVTGNQEQKIQFQNNVQQVQTSIHNSGKSSPVNSNSLTSFKKNPSIINGNSGHGVYDVEGQHNQQPNHHQPQQQNQHQHQQQNQHQHQQQNQHQHQQQNQHQHQQQNQHHQQQQQQQNQHHHQQQNQHQHQQQNQQQQQQQQKTSPPSTLTQGVGATGQKVLLKLNKGLIQGIPGSLVLGNGVHVGYATANAGQHNILLSPQGVINAGGHGTPYQAYYIPLSGLKNGQASQLGNHPAQTETSHTQQPITHIQQNLPDLVTGQIASYGSQPLTQGIINTASLPYVGLPLINNGLHGYTGVGGVPLLQGNVLGVQGLQGMVGGTAIQNGHLGGVLLGGGHAALPNGGLALGSQTNLVHQSNGHGIQSLHQSSGQQQQILQAPVVQTNQRVPLTAGKDVFNFHNTIPYLQQQVTNHQSQVRPQMNTHANGFGLKIQQQHPITQQPFKLGGYQQVQGLSQQLPPFPARNQGFGIQQSVANTLARGYQAFNSPIQLHQPILPTNNQQSGFKLNTLSTLPIKQPPLNIQQKFPYQQGILKRDENLHYPTTLPKLGVPLKDKSTQGWLKNTLPQLATKPGKPLTPFGNSVFPSASPYVIGMKPPTSIPDFIK